MFRYYCPESCGLCEGASQVSFTLAQASPPPPSARMLSEFDLADERNQIRSKCASSSGADLTCVQTEVTRLIEGLQVEGSLKVVESGSLAAGDWRVEVDLVANKQCAATVERVRPRASLVISILDYLGVTVVYERSPICRTTSTIEPVSEVASSADGTQQQWTQVLLALQPRVICAAVRGAGCPAQCNVCTEPECRALCSVCCPGYSGGEGDAPSVPSSPSSTSEGLSPATISLLATTVVGWLLAAVLGAALFRRKHAAAYAPREAAGVSTLTASSVSTTAEVKVDYA